MYCACNNFMLYYYSMTKVNVYRPCMLLNVAQMSLWFLLCFCQCMQKYITNRSRQRVKRESKISAYVNYNHRPSIRVYNYNYAQYNYNYLYSICNSLSSYYLFTKFCCPVHSLHIIVTVMLSTKLEWLYGAHIIFVCIQLCHWMAR